MLSVICISGFHVNVSCQLRQFSPGFVQDVEHEEDADYDLKPQDDITIHTISKHLLHVSKGTTHVSVQNLSGQESQEGCHKKCRVANGSHL